MRNRLLVSLSISVLFTMACSRRADEKKVEEVSSAIRNELPIGCDKSEVFAFLDRKHIPHSEYGESRGDPGMMVAMGSYATVEARIPLHGALPLIRGKSSIGIRFHFDEKGKLQFYTVKQEIKAL